MKKRLCNAVSVIGFLAVLVFAISYTTDILSRKDSVIKYHDLETEGQEIDVMFFGNSHMVNGIYPMELWNEYGMVSYNLGGHGNQIPTTYWVMKNVLDYYNPKLIVIDVFGVRWNDKIRPDRPGIDQQHVSFDWLNVSKNKLGMVNYLFDNTDTKMEFIFPLSIYHDRWSEIRQTDFEINYSVDKGAEYRVNYAVADEFNIIERTEVEMEDSLGKQYLCKMIEECQDRGIEVLLINIPYPADSISQRHTNSVDSIAEQYGVDFLNLLYEDTGVDFFTDMYDNNSHLNPSGARKVTNFVGQYIMGHYDIPDRSDDMLYTQWEEDYKEYSIYKWEQLRKRKEDAWTYLSLLADDNLDICLFFNGDSEMINWSTPLKLVGNLAELTKLQQAHEERKDYFVVIDKGAGCIYEYFDMECAERIDASFAGISYGKRNEQGIRSLKINGDKTNYLVNDDGTMAELAIVSFDKNTGELVDWVRYNLSIGIDGK